MSESFSANAKEVAGLWWEAFPAAFALHWWSVGLINSAVLFLCFLCDLEAGYLILAIYIAVLLCQLAVGVLAFCINSVRCRKGLPMRSSREADELLEQWDRIATGRFWIAAMAAALLLPDWQALGADERANGLVELAGYVFLVMAGMQVVGTAIHPLNWQWLFDAETGALKGGRS